MSDSFTNEDFLAALVDAQETARPRGPGSLAEWQQEQRFGKAPGHFSPGFGLMGHMNTTSRAPTGPPNRPSGNAAVGLKQWPQQFGVPNGINGAASGSKYRSMRPDQPTPWIDDVDMASVWYSPMEPVWPFGPPYYNVPREWNFPVGYNLNYVPQRLELCGMLRGMRKSWGVLSTIIETRKDQLLRLPWTIQVKGKPKASSKAVDAARAFFRKPDGKLRYSPWAHKLLDDLFVIDAPTIYKDRSMAGKLLNAQVLDGGTIFPLIDDAGRRPDSIVDVTPSGITYQQRQPAFQQIIYGLPMIDLSEDEIIYAMQRPLPEMPMFGYSPVEQIFTEATEAIRKTFYQLEFWRAGSMPELIITVPDAWTPRQIASFQGHFDALLSGQLTLKSKVRFVPGGMKPFDIKNASGESLWSQRDELLVRLACYALSVSPTPFIHQNNRATANAAQEASEEEGLYPLMSWWKDDIMDPIIQEGLGFEDVEFGFLSRPEPDQEKQSKIYDLYLKNATMTLNEVRGERGQEPVEDGDVHLIYTPNGAVRLDQVISGEALMPGAPAPAAGASAPPKPAAPSARSSLPVRGPAAPRATSTGTATATQKALTAKELRQAAAETDPKPNKLQRKLGNYKKGRVALHGLKITIENAKGSQRAEKDRFGVKHGVKMPAVYGYINGTLGADGMQVDCYVGKHPKSDNVYIIDQDKFDVDGGDKGFDEHKVMLGYNKPEKAVQDYLASHYDGLGHERLAAMTAMTYGDLKSWLADGDMHKPVSEQGVGHVIARRGDNSGLGKADTISSGTNLSWYSQLPAKRRKSKAKKRLRRLRGPQWLNLVQM